MSKPITNSNSNYNSKKRKMYMDFIMHMDDKYRLKKPPIDVVLDAKEDIVKTVKSLEDEYKLKTGKSDTEKCGISALFLNDTNATINNSTNNNTKFVPLLGSKDPNKYKEKMLVLLEQEIMRLHFSKRFVPFLPFMEAIPPPKLNIENSKPKPKRRVHIDAEINDIDDMLKLTDAYPMQDDVEYNINMAALHKIKVYLQRFNTMVGMKTLKKNIVDQILYFMQDMHLGGKGVSRGDYLHTVICGPPGTGKTHVAKLIGKIFSKLGILKKGTFKKVTRSDLVAGYLGQTAIKTKEVIQESLDGVLFIDEAYALGNSEKRDSFSKECIDTLCEALSNYKENWMVIIAGYDNELNECFFNYNKGLESRFTWRFTIDKYEGPELHKIFLKKITDFGWTADESLKEDWFAKNKDYFTFYGRDMEVLFSKTKIAHSRRIFCKPKEEKKIITQKDLEKGFEMFLENGEAKKRREAADQKYIMNSLYV